jgi:hypothetical protein
MRCVLLCATLTKFTDLKFGLLQGFVKKADEEEVDSEPDLPARAVNL